MSSLILGIIWILGTLAITSIAAIIAKKHGVEYLIGMFAGAIVVTAVVAAKLIVIGPFVVPAAIIVFSTTFLITDIISEFWGRKEAQKAIWAGFLADILLLFFVWVSIHWEPASFWEGQEAFAQTLGSTGRIVLASLTAYIVAQNHDVWAYHFWKKKTNGRHLWLRNNLSTGVSQVIDSVVFIIIAFLGIFPLIPLLISNIVVKFIITVLDTPFIYAIRWYYEKVPPYKKAQPVSFVAPD